MAGVTVVDTDSGESMGFEREQELIERLNRVRPEFIEEEIEEEASFSKFVLSPLAQGFGATLGNAMRRVLISSITGSAVTYVKFEKVLHEYSTVPGVHEDGIELLLNFKALAVHLKGSDNYAILNLDASGIGDVTAADIKPNPDVELLNPDQHLATLTSDNTHLRVEIGIGRGVGYVPSERHQIHTLNPKWGDTSRAPLGVIVLDSKFSPVLKANYTVQNTRLGQDTELDQLVLEVKTNGSISPRDAVTEAANILTGYYNLFAFMPESQDGYEFAADTLSQQDSVLSQSVDILDLPIRPANCLRKIGVHTIGELIQTPETELLKIRNFGEKSLREIQERLDPYGLELSTGARRRRGNRKKEKD
ncbi:MAG TPA: DNA-directed RNA polymerase subunit alpha [bacterium]|jgi:DNA-directed RNA polymerase subunit alpha